MNDTIQIDSAQLTYCLGYAGQGPTPLRLNVHKLIERGGNGGTFTLLHSTGGTEPEAIACEQDGEYIKALISPDKAALHIFEIIYRTAAGTSISSDYYAAVSCKRAE